MKLFGGLSSGLDALRFEGHLASFDGATGWLNSPPLSTEGLRGKVVLVDFWTYTCINWLRTLAWVRAWADKYEEHGLVVVGVHTPEFPFERDRENVERAVAAMDVRYPVALDPDYRVWRAFANRYWPAAYVADTDGRIRHHQFGEGGYEEIERAIQQLLRDAGNDVGDDLVDVTPTGFEVQADWSSLQTPETYVGYDYSENLASPGGVFPSERRTYELPDRLSLNRWALSGSWTVAQALARSDEPDAAIAFRFHARDLNLVMGPAERGASVRIRVTIDGEHPGRDHGFDVDETGAGTVTEQRLHQLIRQHGRIEERTFELTSLDPGIELYCFTFG